MNFIRCNEQFTRDATRVTWINLDNVVALSTLPNGNTRVRTVDSQMIDIVESIDYLIGTYETLTEEAEQVLTEEESNG